MNFRYKVKYKCINSTGESYNSSIVVSANNKKEAKQKAENTFKDSFIRYFLRAYLV